MVSFSSWIKFRMIRSAIKMIAEVSDLLLDVIETERSIENDSHEHESS